MNNLDEFKSTLNFIPKMRISPAGSGKFFLECPGIYAAYRLNPFDIRDYFKVIALRDYLKRYIFDSPLDVSKSLLGQMWMGHRHFFSMNVSDKKLSKLDFPRFAVVPNIGIRYHECSTGAEVMRSSSLPWRDCISFTISPGMGQHLVELHEFAIYLHERGFATITGECSIQSDLKARLQRMMLALPTYSFVGFKNAVLTQESGCDIDIEKSILADVSIMMGATPLAVSDAVKALMKIDSRFQGLDDQRFPQEIEDEQGNDVAQRILEPEIEISF